MKEKVMNLSHLSANDLKTRNTTTMPEAANTEIEMEIMCVTRNVEEQVDKLIKEQKAKKVKFQHNNLSTANILGLEELK